jgi:quinol monooxygenase YgiN
MTAARQALQSVALLAGLAIMPALAQTAPETNGPRYVAAYIEVMPSAASDGATLVRAFRDAGRQEPGNLRLEAAQRIGQPNQFVVLEAWQDEAALDAHAKAPAITEFHEKLKPIEDAPDDRRVNGVLTVGPLSTKFADNAVLTVTHVDVVPTHREAATGLVKALAEKGRGEPGNLRYEALVQAGRPNHFTVIAAWRDRGAAEAHDMGTTARAFREQLAPMAGALYDERLYRPLD